MTCSIGGRRVHSHAPSGGDEQFRLLADEQSLPDHFEDELADHRFRFALHLGGNRQQPAPAIVSGALKAYTPGSGLGSGAIAVAMSAMPSGAMSRRVLTIAASVTGLPVGLYSRRTATVATLLDLISDLTGSNT